MNRAQSLPEIAISKHPEIGVMVRRLAHELLADDEKLLADAHGVAPTPVGA